ncbi:MAG: hypothetical protein ACXWQX_03845 [Bdellovibrio sp.]
MLHPRKVAITFLFASVFLSFGLTKLKTLLAFEDVVDSSFISKQQLDSLLKEFKIHGSMLLAVKKPDNGWNDQNLCAINKWLTELRIKNFNILTSISALDIRKSEFHKQSLSYPRVLKLSCLDEFGYQSLKEEIAVQLLEVNKSPLGFSLLGKNSDDWMVQIDLKDAEDGGRFGSFNPLIVEEIQKSFLNEMNKQRIDLQYSWIGTADFQYFFYIGLKRVNVLNIILLVLFILLFRFFFGTWRSGVIYCFSIFITGIISYGLMGWFGVPIDILSKNLFLMIAVAALEDFVYLSAKTYELKGRWRRAWCAILMPGFLTSLTTILGFLSLGISDLQIIRRFGFWSAVGSLVEWSVVFVMLPAIFKIFPWWSQFTDKSLARGYEIFNHAKLLKIPRMLSYGLLLIFPFVPMSFNNLNVKDIPLEMFEKDHSFKKGVLDIKKRNGWESQISLVFKFGTDEAEIHKIVEKISQLPGVVKIMGSAELFSYFTKDIHPPEIKSLIFSELKSASFMENWISARGNQRYNLFLEEGDTESINNLGKSISKICEDKGCFISGVPVVYSEFAKKIPETLLNSFSLSIFLVGFILIWLSYCCGYFSQVHWILLSSFWGPSLMFLLISIFSIKVNFLTCIFASVLVGLTGDNAIQFLIAAKGKSFEKGIMGGGGAALVSGFLMASGSLVFLGSYFIPPRIFGVLLMAGFLASTLGDYWLLQALVRKKRNSI